MYENNPRLADQHLEKSKQYALTHGMTFTAIAEVVVREKLMIRPPIMKLARIKLETVNGKRVNAEIDLDDSAS